MAYIETVPVGAAEGAVRALYERAQAGRGYVPNYTKAFCHRPDVYAAWGALIGSISGRMDPRRYELVTVAAARALGSSYCALAHGSALLEKGLVPPESVRAVAVGETAATGVSPADAAAMRFAERVARDARAIRQEDVRALRDHGLSDAEIFDVAAAAAARSFFSKLLDALGVMPDAAYRALEEEVRTPLTVGRPIDDTPAERVTGAG